MKRIVIGLSCIAFALGILSPCLISAEEGRNHSQGEKVLGVDEFMKNVKKYPGSVKIKGLVKGVWPDRKLVALTDLHEAEHGRGAHAGHSHMALPVSWAGAAPKVKDTVIVEGKVEKRNKKLVFVASNLKKVTSH